MGFSAQAPIQKAGYSWMLMHRLLCNVQSCVTLPLRRYIVKVTVTGKGMMPDSRSETGIWVRNYEEVSTALAAPIKVGCVQ